MTLKLVLALAFFIAESLSILFLKKIKDRTVALVSKGAIAEAKITKLEEDTKNPAAYTAYYNFTDAMGKQYEGITNLPKKGEAGRPLDYKEGDSLHIRYETKDPAFNRLESSLSRTIKAYTTVIFVLVVPAVGMPIAIYFLPSFIPELADILNYKLW
jgi:hypothetical protein